MRGRIVFIATIVGAVVVVVVSTSSSAFLLFVLWCED
jgi:hypothetical protein